MPLLLVPAIVLLAVVVGIALMPIGLVQRYRSGTARRQARGWLTSLNIYVLAFSVLLYLGSAALAALWLPHAFSYSLAGLVVGGILGIVGLYLTKWEPSIDRLHYTPNRLLVLLVTLIVTARLVYGVWRLWHSWPAETGAHSWLMESGVPGSMAAGALVLGYTFTYWVGIGRRIRQYR